MATFTAPVWVLINNNDGTYEFTGTSASTATVTDNDAGSDEIVVGEIVTVTSDGNSADLEVIGTIPGGIIVNVSAENGVYIGTSPLPAGTIFTPSDDPFVVCFAEGTLIATPGGEKAVETLVAGDLVLTLDGSTRSVLWIGRQTIVPLFADPLRSSPIRIAAGAFEENIPTRDLYVSPDHGLMIDGVLIQAGALVNGTSIVRTKPEAAFTYYHIELQDHALVLAEGAPAETFVDNVTRRRFDNYAEYEAQFGPSWARIPELAMPRVKSARQLPRAVRETLAARAAALGFVSAAAA
ncbi:Hint domain-containing protein [Chelatococcus reniformis]|uniref:Hedgehog/Intein (Hint) domain-containing protein n=1 Tax=Chelatococcus reniformis TaxID=1494448 RepID=A0A916X985_9HYPH|nr:Hint domain-containing protein [Chelatococcus reniformis]GGC54012.1 hypothetical protein GCM10010994_11220 [Chelatococcus reniformis]